MALVWDWNEKVGEVVMEQTLGEEVRQFTYDLYEGNAFLICINEYQEEGKDMYSLSWFFMDKQHAKVCLGLTKNHDNMFNRDYQRLVKIRVNKEMCKNWKDIVTIFAQAFDDITIELYRA